VHAISTGELISFGLSPNLGFSERLIQKVKLPNPMTPATFDVRYVTVSVTYLKL